MFFIRNKLQERSKERPTEIEVFHTKRTVGDVLKHANTTVTEKPTKAKTENSPESSQKTETKKTETKNT